MKVAITADLHLSDKDNCPERYNVLGNIFQLIEEENIENLIIAGDLFDKDFHNHIEFEKLCKKHPKIQFYIIPGNHDPNISEKSIVATNIHIYTVTTATEIGSTTFLFVPFEKQTNMSEKIASKEGEIKEKEWVLIGHGDYYEGVKEPNPLEPGTYMPLSRETIITFSPRAVFLGHIHKQVNWQNIYYVGSPCGQDNDWWPSSLQETRPFPIPSKPRRDHPGHSQWEVVTPTSFQQHNLQVTLSDVL